MSSVFAWVVCFSALGCCEGPPILPGAPGLECDEVEDIEGLEDVVDDEDVIGDIPPMVGAGSIAIAADDPRLPQLKALGLLRRGPARSWGCEQATGEPDTKGAGDITTAWAAATQDDQDEWLELTYAVEIKPVEVHVVETYNPGALFKVTAPVGDMEAVLWKGEDPTPRDADRGTSIVKITAGIKTKRIRIHLASKDVPGWNEIDAVGMKDEEGKMHWPIAATASSNYAGDVEPGWMLDTDAMLKRLLELQTQVEALQQQMKEAGR